MKFVGFFLAMSLSVVCLACSRADFNRDGTVDFHDFSVLANDWLIEDVSEDEAVVRDNLHSSIKGIRGLSEPIPLKILAHMDDAENWDTSSANIEFDATKSINGIQSLKITSPSNTMVQTGWVDFFPDTCGGKTAITGCTGIWLYTDSNCTDVETIEVQFLPHKCSTSNYYRAVLVDSTWPKWSYVKNDWWLIMLNPLRFGKAGSVASWSKDQKIQSINIKFKSMAGAETHLWVGGIFCEDFPKAAIVLGWDGVYPNWRPDMIESRGWKGYMAVRGYSTWVGEPSRVGISTLKEWYDKGWDVFPHAWDLCSEDANEAVIREDCIKSMHFMAANGFHRGTFLGSSCGTYGIRCTDANIGAREIAADYKVASRGVWGSPIAYARTGNGRPPVNVATETPSWICADWHNMHDITLSISLEAAKNYVDEAILLNGIQSFHAHGISDSGELDISESNFAEFLDYIKAYEQQGKLEVITFTEWLNMTLMRPGCIKAGKSGQIFINSNEYKRLY